MIQFHMDLSAGVVPYLQLVQQVKQALRLGMLQPGDQLPTVKEVVAQLAINPNTVLKAYRELEHEGLVGGRPGQGTFVLKTLGGIPATTQAALRRRLLRWLHEAFEAGMDIEGIQALFATTLRNVQEDGEEVTA